MKLQIILLTLALSLSVSAKKLNKKTLKLQKQSLAQVNEQARASLQLAKKGMAIAAVEELFKIKQPKLIDRILARDLKEAIPPRHTVWTTANISWSSDWSTIFPEPTATIVHSSQIESPLNRKALTNAETLLKGAKVNTNERARLLWVLAHHYALENKSAQASPLLEELMKSEQTLIESDLIIMTVARLYFQMNQFEKSIAHYNMIPKESDYWLESVEERAWSYFRKGDYDRVQSDMKTLMNPMFANQVGPEPFFLDGFAKLKVCDYSGIFKIIKDFKSSFKQRISAIDNLSQTGTNAVSDKAISSLSNGPSEFEKIGQPVSQMPRHFYRDWRLVRMSMRKAEFERENQEALESSPELAVRLNLLANEAQKKVQQRIKALANLEVEEARKILNKFHILEAEVIQRMHLQDKKSTKDIGHQKIAADEIEFPVNDDEVWVDEVDKFQVISRGCPSSKEKTL